MLKRILAAVALIAFDVAAASAAEKQPFTVDDVYRVEQITDFKVSPRGDEAVYVRHFYDVNYPERRTVLWRIDGATGRREPLEVGEPDGKMPVYSPDGKELAYVSNEIGHSSWSAKNHFPKHSEPTGHLRVLARDYDPQHPQSNRIPEKLGGYIFCDPFYARISFSPKGKSLAVVAGAQWERHLELREKHLAEGSTAAFDDQGEGYEGYGNAQVEIYGPPKYEKDRDNRWNWHAHSDAKYAYGDPQWSPDEEFIIFHANRTDDQESVRYSINKNFDLWRARLIGTHWDDRVEQLTTNGGPDVSPRISPDGKHVLYLSVPRKGPHMDVFNLCVLPLDGEKPEPRVLVDAHDAEGKAERDAAGSTPWQPTFPLRDDCWIDAQHVRVNGVQGMKAETRVFNIAGPDAPISADAKPEPEPHKNPRLKKPEANPWLDDRLHGPQEVVRWKSFDGLEIEGVLTLPPAELTQFKKPYPVIVYPHGGPHSASRPEFNITLQVFASAGYAVFQPNYRGSYGYGRKFLDAAWLDMGGSDMQDILTGVDALIERGVVDAERQFVYGSSYGGYSACRLVTLTDRFRAVVAQNAVTDLHAMWRLSDIQSWTEWEFGGKPWETIKLYGKTIDVGEAMRERSPTTHAHKAKTPTLLLHADHDRRCPLPMGQMFYRILKENGCPTELVVYTDERHQIWQVKHQADVLQRTLAWFAQHDKEP